jgi:predicted amidohydrolase YtcJ
VGRAYIYKELLDQNGLLALGTDFPVEGISPMATFYSAVVRKDNNGMPEGGFQMENAISRREAMMGMTIWNALSNFEDSYKGSLQVGKVADFVVMDRDVMKCDESQIKESEVVLTVIDGEVVWERK